MRPIRRYSVDGQLVEAGHKSGLDVVLVGDLAAAIKRRLRTEYERGPGRVTLEAIKVCEDLLARLGEK